LNGALKNGGQIHAEVIRMCRSLSRYDVQKNAYQGCIIYA